MSNVRDWDTDEVVRRPRKTTDMVAPPVTTNADRTEAVFQELLDQAADRGLEATLRDAAKLIVEAPLPKVKGIWTEAGGTAVCYDHCGTCVRHVNRCTCVGGPTEPAYIAKWRTEGGDPLVPTTTHVGSVDSAIASPAEPSDAVASRAVAAASSWGPKCTECDKPVSDKNADRNDDQTWTCWVCQEKGSKA